MTIQLIYYQEKPGEPRELWANYQGMKAEAENSARGLLDELHEEGLTRARVWVGKTLIKRERKP